MLKSIFPCCDIKDDYLSDPLLNEYNQMEVQMDINTSVCIYILECEEDKKYIGRVNTKDDVQKRFMKHKSGEGSAFTRKYKPIKIERIIENVNIFDEDSRVIEYMNKYGIDQ